MILPVGRGWQEGIPSPKTRCCTQHLKHTGNYCQLFPACSHSISHVFEKEFEWAHSFSIRLVLSKLHYFLSLSTRTCQRYSKNDCPAVGSTYLTYHTKPACRQKRVSKKKAPIVEERSFYGTGHFKANFVPGNVFLPPFFWCVGTSTKIEYTRKKRKKMSQEQLLATPKIADFRFWGWGSIIHLLLLFRNTLIASSWL